MTPEDLRFLTLVRLRQFGAEKVTRALLRDPEALAQLRLAHAAKPSDVIEKLLEAIDGGRRVLDNPRKF